MRNVRLTLEYEGTNYCGWQLQKRSKAKSVQEIVEVALRRILQEKVKLIGSGRTDSGVHALAQVANFKTKSALSLEKLQRSLNSLLPADIAVREIEEAGRDFHSRYSASSKVYRYSILNTPQRSAFLKNNAYFYPYGLDLSLMHKEAKSLLGRHDFKSFCASGSSVKSTVRTIKRMKFNVEIRPQGGRLIHIDIEADGFLYNMARNIVGTLIEVGRGKFPKGSLKRVLAARNRTLAGPTAPARGLCLIKVEYRKFID